VVTLAVIPARGGSKGVIRKNLRLVNGSSLLERAIKSANTPLIDDILVSTEDVEIRAEAIKCGALVPFQRPLEYASDEAATVDVVMNAVSNYQSWSGRTVTTVVLLEPTSPFRKVSHVEAGLRLMKGEKYKSLVSVCPVDRKPQNIYEKTEFLTKYIRDPIETFTRRQDMKHLCRINSAIYIFLWNDFRSTKQFFSEPLGWIDMDAEESINIDTELDLKICELVAEKLD
jgi:CMP-N,N'-diacetyllegionaminic acid synthase